MKPVVQEYTGKGVLVRFDLRVCTHSGNCVRRLPAVFDVKKRPWVNAEGADAEAIIQTIKACPSGALSFEQV